MKKLNKLAVWWRVYVHYEKLWRVVYPDERRTRLLHYHEAKNLKKIFGGKLIIDYKA